MAVPSATGSGIINEPTAYGASSQVTSTNLNEHVRNAVFNANAVDGVTINADSNGKNLFVVDGSISVAKTSFLGTVDTTADSNVKILSKQSDGQYDSVTPSGDVTMSQAGAFTIAAGAVEGTMLNSNTVDDSTIELSSNTLSVKDSGVSLAKIANIADDTVLGNVSGSSAAPSALSASDLVTLIGATTISPSSVSASTNTITFGNGLVIKFGTYNTGTTGSTETVNFSSYGGNFTNDCYVVMMMYRGVLSGVSTNLSLVSKSASNFVFRPPTTAHANQDFDFIALGF